MYCFRLGHPLARALRNDIVRCEAPNGTTAIAVLDPAAVVLSDNATTLQVPLGAAPARPTDLLLLVQYSNHTPVTPAGWTPLLSVTNAGFGQRLDLYTAPGSTPSPVTIAQDLAGRLQGVVVPLRPPTGKTISAPVLYSATDPASTVNPHTMVAGTAQAGTYGLGVALTIAAVQLTGPAASVSPNAGWTNLLGTQTNLRLGLGWRATALSGLNALLPGSFTASAFPQDGSVTCNWSLAKLVFVPG